MKKIYLFLFLIAAFVASILYGCQKQPVEPSVNNTSALKNSRLNKSTTAVNLTAAPSVYALVLSSGAASPVPAGLQSFLYGMNLSPTGSFWTSVKKIKINGTQVTGVTGICDIVGLADYAYAVTGQNSNFPNKILKVRLSTGLAGIKATTAIPLQDIENYGYNFVAIQEGTSQLVNVNMSTGATTIFAPAGPTAQYNGLTIVGNKFYAISGLTSLNCSPNTGDIFEYAATGGSPTASYSYQNLAGNPSWTGSELGFMYDNNFGKNWIVGSSSQVLTNKLNVTTCGTSNPSFLNAYSRPIYDFLVKP